MANYHITLKPVEYFFFGGEKHDAELKTNYFVESNDYPQQTTLLGLLRYFLLIKHNLISGKRVNDRIEAEKLIGTESFDYTNPKQSFRKIKSISPLYFVLDEEKYFFAPLDIRFTMSDGFVLHKNEQPYFAKKHEKYIQPHLISNSGKLCELNSIINKIEQVGNEKGEKGATKENAFYKQIMKKLDDGWCFAIDAEIEDEIKEKDYILPFGGEKCHFVVSFKKEDESFEPVYPQKHSRSCYSIICPSDCFIDGKLIKDVEFAVNSYVSFRNFRSKLETENQYALKNKSEDINKGMIRSKRYQLLQRGSALYFNDDQKRDKIVAYIEKQNGNEYGFNKILINNK